MLQDLRMKSLPVERQPYIKHYLLLPRLNVYYLIRFLFVLYQQLSALGTELSTELDSSALSKIFFAHGGSLIDVY